MAPSPSPGSALTAARTANSPASTAGRSSSGIADRSGGSLPATDTPAANAGLAASSCASNARRFMASIRATTASVGNAASILRRRRYA